MLATLRRVRVLVWLWHSSSVLGAPTLSFAQALVQDDGHAGFFGSQPCQKALLVPSHAKKHTPCNPGCNLRFSYSKLREDPNMRFLVC